MTHVAAFNAGVVVGLVWGPTWALWIALAWLACIGVRHAVLRLTEAEDRTTARRRWWSWTAHDLARRRRDDG